MGRADMTFADLTTLRVGGGIGHFLDVTDTDSLLETLATIDDVSTETLFILGRGSNIIASDTGWPGTVVRLDGGAINPHVESDRTVYTVDAGVDWDQFVQRTIADRTVGIELLSGIPGRVGAAPIQNIAAYGQQVADVINAVETFDRTHRSVEWVTKAECAFGFRTSRFKHDWHDRIVTRVRFELPDASQQPPTPSTYVDVERHFATHGGDPTDLAARRAAVLAARGAKSMLDLADDPLTHSVGSFFVNPVVPVALAHELGELFQVRHLSVQYLEAEADRRDGMVRVPGALVLRYAGFHPGDRWGNVQLSDRHLLAIVARPGATATDVWRVGHHVKTRVADTVGSDVLQFEPRFIGIFDDPRLDRFESEYAFTRGDGPEPSWLTGYRTKPT